MSEQLELDLSFHPSRGRGKPRFTPRVTVRKDGTLRIRQTTTVVTFDATVDPADIPAHRYDRQQWVIGLCRDWYERIHLPDRRAGLPYPAFGTEDLVLATRFADAVLVALDDADVHIVRSVW